jgi:hypothetical protein
MSGCPVGWDPGWGAERGKKWGEVITLRSNLPGVTDGDSGSPVWVVAAATGKCIDAKTHNPQVFGYVVQRKWGGGPPRRWLWPTQNGSWLLGRSHCC